MSVQTADQAIATPAAAAPFDAEAARKSAPVQMVLWTMCFLHFANDLLQSLMSAILPILKDNLHLDYAQTRLIVSVYMAFASLIQPFVGMYTDKRPSPWALSTSMIATAAGVAMLTFAGTYQLVLLAAVFIGIGSAIFHPEGSRMTRLAGGNRPGVAQATFQVGGNFGQASGPLLAAFVIVPFGQSGIGWFVLVALLAYVIMLMVGRWAAPRIHAQTRSARATSAEDNPYGLTRGRLIFLITILLILMFSKSVYSVSLSTFYTFYLMEKFAIPLRDAQLYLFLFMGSVAAGVYFGGPIGDRIGRKYVIWISILGALPFTLILPYANLMGSAVLTVIIGFIMSASMSQIMVYAMELAPRKVGVMSGLFFGFGFGIAGVAATALGYLVDRTSLEFVYKVCSFLPLIGLATVFLPDLRKKYGN